MLYVLPLGIAPLVGPGWSAAELKGDGPKYSRGTGGGPKAAETPLMFSPGEVTANRASNLAARCLGAHNARTRSHETVDSAGKCLASWPLLLNARTSATAMRPRRFQGLYVTVNKRSGRSASSGRKPSVWLPGWLLLPPGGIGGSDESGLARRPITHPDFRAIGRSQPPLLDSPSSRAACAVARSNRPKEDSGHFGVSRSIAGC
jgi:hypothetical protein